MFGLGLINTTHLIAHQLKLNNVKKVNFTKVNFTKKKPKSIYEEEELVKERSKASIKTYLEELKEKNLKNWDKYSTQIEKLGLWLIEKKNFHFDCANHFAKTAEKLVKVAEENNQDIEKVVNYNIKYNKFCHSIYAIGEKRKSKKT